jgi:oxygen-independent coproporphyrinogen-3 oxidase
MDSYIGVGLSAHSYFDGERFYNTSDLSRYLSGSERIFDIARTKEEERTEYVMLSLRTKHGFSNNEYKERYLDDFIELNRKKIEKYEKLGLLICDSERISLTESGFYVSNFIIADLL